MISSPADGPDRRFQALLTEHGAALGRVAASYTRNSAERDDLLQEIAIAIWRALPQFRAECSERTFVFRIAHNRGMSHLARRRLPLADVELDGDLAVADRRPDPEASLFAEERGRSLQQAIRRLPVQYRQVVVLALEGMSYSEIGEVIGATENNVGVRLTRARDMLRRLLQQQNVGARAVSPLQPVAKASKGA